MAAAGLGQLIVGAAGQLLALRRAEHMRAWGGEGDHRAVDARGVHVGQPALSQIQQPLEDARRARRGRSRIKSPKADEAGIIESVFDEVFVSSQYLGRDERFLGGDPQISLSTAGLKLGVAHA